jgi:hypothetical protein
MPRQEEMLDVFRMDPEFAKNEELWGKIRKEILGDDASDSSDSDGSSGSGSGSDSSDEDRFGPCRVSAHYALS